MSNDSINEEHGSRNKSGLGAVTVPYSSTGQNNVGSQGSLIGAQKPSDVAIRISKINIAIKPDNGNKAHENSQNFKNSQDSRDRMNYSNMTNYYRNAGGPMFDEDGNPYKSDDEKPNVI